MNVKGDANRSVQQTKRRLHAALVALLEQKPLREITVRELVDRAGISRGSFYFHYRDLDALMAELEQEHLHQLERLMDALMPSIGQHSMPPALPALKDEPQEVPTATSEQGKDDGEASSDGDAEPSESDDSGEEDL